MSAILHSVGQGKRLVLYNEVRDSLERESESEEMAQQLKARTAPAEEPSSIPNTHVRDSLTVKGL